MDTSSTKNLERSALCLHLQEEEDDDDDDDDCDEQLHRFVFDDDNAGDDDCFGGFGGKSYNLDAGNVDLLR